MLGLLLKFDNPVIGIRVHDSKAAGLFQRHINDRHSQTGMLILVLSEHVVIVHLVNMVARENEDIFGVDAVDISHILVYGMAGPQEPAIPLLGGIGLEDGCTGINSVQAPGRSVSNMAV